MKAFAKTYLTHYVPVKFARHHEELFHAIPHGARGQKVNVLASARFSEVDTHGYHISYVAYMLHRG